MSIDFELVSYIFYQEKMATLEIFASVQNGHKRHLENRLSNELYDTVDIA